ncbi:hypothetical protein AVEN_26268-1 [Araneus ventricosus]|uniref:Uncharacterized protein n=1 Tax=Araneus ventricosus TaxID=182803 RepID=A0A4Y2APB2_ARAVE|nr:hypothetical protein AVEN_26268-1 [Araneus ventricosus]
MSCRTALANEVAVLSETPYQSRSIAKVRKSKRFYDWYSKVITSVSVYKDEDIVLSSSVAGCCWHGDTPWGNKLALVGHHLGSGWIFTGRATLHGDFGVSSKTFFLNLLDSYIIGRHYPLQLQQMDSCVWRETIHSLFSGDSARQTVAPDGFCAPGFVIGQQGPS